MEISKLSPSVLSNFEILLCGESLVKCKYSNILNYVTRLFTLFEVVRYYIN